MMKAFWLILFLGINLLATAQWSQIYENNDFAGQTDVFFLNADTGFVVGTNSMGGFILRTHDGGASWDSLRYADNQFPSIFMTSADTGYIASFRISTHQVSVMRTIDGGDSWQMVATDLGSAISVPYAISFYDNSTGIINLQNYTAKTSDAGETWIQCFNFPNNGYRDGDISNGIYVSAGIELMGWSVDSAVTFGGAAFNYQGAHNYLKVKDYRFIESATGNHGNELQFPQYSFGIITIGDVLTQEWDITYYPYLSRIYGVSWPAEDIMYAICRPIYNEGADEKFFMKSIDGGQTWYRQETIEPYYYGTQQIFCPNDSVCYAVGGFGGRIYKTTNGGGPLIEEVTQVPLSVKEIKDDLHFSMAPNPTSGRFTIKSEKEQIKRIEVYDLQGKAVLTTFPQAFSATVDLSSVPAGVYMVQILAGDMIRTGKIVVE